MLSYFQPAEKSLVPPLTAEEQARRYAFELEKYRKKRINSKWLERAKLEWKLPALRRRGAEFLPLFHCDATF
jgi:hypothetical protein